MKNGFSPALEGSAKSRCQYSQSRMLAQKIVSSNSVAIRIWVGGPLEMSFVRSYLPRNIHLPEPRSTVNTSRPQLLCNLCKML